MTRRSRPCGLIALALAAPVAAPALAAQQDSPAAQDPPARETPEPRESYRGREIARTMHWKGAEWLLRDERAREERTALMLEELRVRPGEVVCDLGCGNGYLTLPLARLVGERGEVLAVDLQPQMLAMLRERAAEAGIDNVRPVLGAAHDPNLPPESCDLVLMVDVYHELSNPETVLRGVRAALVPTGRLVLVEFRTEDPELRIKPKHRMSQAQILNELGANGFRLRRSFDGLPQQHLMVFERRPQAEQEGPGERRLAQGREVALGLRRALGRGDLAALEAFLARRVRVQADSAGARERWGLEDARHLGRAEVRRRLEGMLTDLDGWRASWGRGESSAGEPGTGKTGQRIAVAAPDPAFAPAAPGGPDLALEVVARTDGRRWSFRLAEQPEGRWLVVGLRAR